MQPDNNTAADGAATNLAGGDMLGYTPNMPGATISTPEAEKEVEAKEKKPLGFIISIILLAITTLGLGVYMIMDLLAGAPKCPECEVCIDPATSQVEVVDFYFDSLAVLHQGEVFVNIYGASPDFVNLYGQEAYDALVQVRENYELYELGSSSVRINNEDFTGMKLDAENVIGVFDYEAGQAVGNDYGLLLLYDDATVGYISLLSMMQGETEVTPLDGVTSIVNIVSRSGFGGMETYAITSSGTEVKLSNYITAE
ncbi:MAG: hypothetical protein Q4B65_00115 [Candidatus Saccharibacteria bacterium]|nr:hypothetical protein [Candidatus Saccharibacteria bacterium]